MLKEVDMVEDANKKIEEAKERIREKQERQRFLRRAGTMVGVGFGIATAIFAPKISQKNELNDTKNEVAELVEVNSQETVHETAIFKCKSKNTVNLLKENGYSLNLAPDFNSQDYLNFKCDIVDSNNNTVGLANVVSEDELLIYNLTVLKDSSLMDLISSQPESDFQKQRDSKISFIQGERITQAFNRHDRIENLQRKEKQLKETITGVREVYRGTF